MPRDFIPIQEVCLFITTLAIVLFVNKPQKLMQTINNKNYCKTCRLSVTTQSKISPLPPVDLYYTISADNEKYPGSHTF